MFEANVSSKVPAPASPEGELLTEEGFAFGTYLDGQTFQLQRFLALPASEKEGDIEWAQSMGKVVILYQLPEKIDESNLVVEINRWQVKVSVAEGKHRRELPAVSGDLRYTVRRLNSFWRLEANDDQAGAGGDTLVIFLTKQEHLPWKELWKPISKTSTIYRRTPFVYGNGAYMVTGEDRWMALPRDEPQWGSLESPNIDKPYSFKPRKLCVGADDAIRDGCSASVHILFDRHELMQLHAFCPLEDILCADVTETQLRVYIKLFVDGRYIHIFEGDLEGPCIPEKSSWEMAWCRHCEEPFGDFPALRVNLVLRGEAQSGGPVFRSRRHVTDLGVPEQVEGVATEQVP